MTCAHGSSIKALHHFTALHRSAHLPAEACRRGKEPLPGKACPSGESAARQTRPECCSSCDDALLGPQAPTSCCIRGGSGVRLRSELNWATGLLQSAATTSMPARTGATACVVSGEDWKGGSRARPSTDTRPCPPCGRDARACAQHRPPHPKAPSRALKTAPHLPLGGRWPRGRQTTARAAALRGSPRATASAPPAGGWEALRGAVGSTQPSAGDPVKSACRWGERARLGPYSFGRTEWPRMGHAHGQSGQALVPKSA